MIKKHISVAVKIFAGMTNEELESFWPNISGPEISERLKAAQAKGYLFIPRTDCDNFEKNGQCAGHEEAA